MSDYARTGEACGAGFGGEPHRFTGDTSDGIPRCVLCAKRWAPAITTSEVRLLTLTLPTTLTDRVNRYAANGEMSFDEALVELIGDALDEAEA
jgi:hypothetical protein